MNARLTTRPDLRGFSPSSARRLWFAETRVHAFTCVCLAVTQLAGHKAEMQWGKLCREASQLKCKKELSSCSLISFDCFVGVKVRVQQCALLLFLP